MHVLSHLHRSEFLAIPELIRATMAIGRYGREPTLLIRSSTLTLKYLVRLKSLEFAATILNDGRLVYGVRIPDDPLHPALIWSVAERQEELTVLRTLSTSQKCVVFLFNEALANIAWGEVSLVGDTADLNRLALLWQKFDFGDSHFG